jgi:hypothetical protein
MMALMGVNLERDLDATGKQVESQESALVMEKVKENKWSFNSLSMTVLKAETIEITFLTGTSPK